MGKSEQVKSISGKMFKVVQTLEGPDPIETQNEEEAVYILTPQQARRCPYCRSSRCLIPPVLSEWLDMDYRLRIKNRDYYYRVLKCGRYTKAYFLLERYWFREANRLLPRCNNCNSREIIRQDLFRLRKRVDIPKNISSSVLNLPEQVPDIIAVDYETCHQCKKQGIVTYDFSQNRPGALILRLPWNWLALVITRKYMLVLCNWYDSSVCLKPSSLEKALCVANAYVLYGTSPLLVE